MTLEVRALAKTYAGQSGPVPALLPTSFSVESGAFVTLLGPSGCGKSTLLHLIGGLDEPTSGDVQLDGARIRGPGPQRGMVFQSYTLFPWLNVLDNACFSTQLARNRSRPGMNAAAAAERARWLLELMGLGDFLQAYPRELSGGMKQRVAIARALTNRPQLLLMDEPFGALDAQTREEMQELMLLLHAHEQTTVLFVTHDVKEAIYLSSRVLVFSPRPGRILRDVAVPFGPSSTRRSELQYSAEFMDLERELRSLLHPEARSQGRGALLDQLVRPTPRSLQS
ncbi:MAG TPA: ABC transporter ATP-binding protein [Polyangiaceae bacterium]|nr:ABC transporter ATP-binding protein [Polyangiaceae bacterium]